MARLLICFFAAVFVSTAHAKDSSSDAYDLLTSKIIKDFQEGVKLYNEKKEAGAPAIKRGKALTWNMNVKSAHVHFTLVNYLNDQIYVNDRLVQRSTFGIITTTNVLPDFLISTANAEEGNLDAGTTKIILTALGSLSQNLEEVGMLCFSGCQKEIRNKNLQKVLKTLDNQHEDCTQQQYSQENSINKFPSYRMVSLLHSTFNPEFQSVKKFIQKISEANKKKSDEFMTDKLAIENKYQSCVGVMTAGTLADGSDAMKTGIRVLNAGRIVSEAIEAEKEKAKGICVKMEELKNCLVSLKRNLNKINSIKREQKRNTGYDSPTETLPNIDTISR